MTRIVVFFIVAPTQGKGWLMPEHEFVARYKGSTHTHPGIEEIRASNRRELLEKAQAISKESGLPLTLISVRDWGGVLQVWNAERAARPQRKGDGWREDIASDFLDTFPE